MPTNPYDDERFRDRITAQTIAHETAIRRLTAMVAGILANGDAESWREVLFQFERNCIADIGTMTWPNANQLKVAEIKALSAEEISEMLSVLKIGRTDNR